MVADKDGGASAASQSKRPPLQQQDSGSQPSNAPHEHQEPHSRQKHHKHVVGGGAGRIHARVPSSKALHKQHPHHQRRRTSSPDRAALLAQLASHRRTGSDVKLPREPSATNLKKNASHTSLARNRSHVDVTKRSKSSTHLKRSFSGSGLDKTKSGKTQVHFDLGDEEEDDAQDDDWVDASTSASPFLSRRGSQSSSRQPTSRGDSGPTSPQAQRDDTKTTTAADRETLQHKEFLTSRLLNRTPSHGAPPKMSEETASGRPTAPRRSEAEPDLGREPTGGLSGTPEMIQHATHGSSGKDAMTSRFVTNSQGSGLTAEGSFYAPQPRAGGREDDGNDLAHRRRRPLGAPGQTNAVSRSVPTYQDAGANDASALSDDEGGAFANRASNDRRGTRRTGGSPYSAAPAELSRTQQKLNLERASSNIEPSHRDSRGPVAGALIGGAGYDSRDPRITKILERTGQEYLVVRRYQNPVARSLARLSQLPGAEKGRRIPNKANGSTPGRGGHAKRASEYDGGRFGLSQNFRERDTREIHSSGGGGPSARPLTPRRTFNSIRSNGAGSSTETEAGSARMHGGLSGSSLVDGEEDDGTVALLRNLWEKNMDLSASQD